MTCQKCRIPLLIEDSIAALSPSAYDFITSSHLAESTHPTQFKPLPNHFSSRNSTIPRSHPIRVTNELTEPRIEGRMDGRFGLGGVGNESFVVLTESVVRPARLATPSTSVISAEEEVVKPISNLLQLSKISELLSKKTGIDHPICTECTTILITQLNAELSNLTVEKEKLSGFLRDFKVRREQSLADGVTKETLTREIGKLKKAEVVAKSELVRIEEERVALKTQREQLELEEAELTAEEEAFWKSHSKYTLEAGTLRDRNTTLKNEFINDTRTLEALKKTNVYSDAFCIGQEAGFGTINGLRFGRLPGTQVEWSEINAAWGSTLLLLHTIARKYGFNFEHYRLLPMGSFSKIEKYTGDKGIYELYGSSEFQLSRLLQNRRFDFAQVAFLDCLRQLMEYVQVKEPGLKLPYSIVKDKVGDISIKLQFGSEEVWTRALRHILLNLKILLAKASAS